jgi:PPOX class probable F420-dependent enzyme
MASLPDAARAWFDAPEFVTLCTLMGDGQPHLSVLWVARDGDDLLMATVVGRQNHTNLVRDPRATVLLSPQGDPYSYCEVRGTATLTEEGGRELIDDLHEKYRGSRPYPLDVNGEVRAVIRLTPRKVVLRDISAAARQVRAGGGSGGDARR